MLIDSGSSGKIRIDMCRQFPLNLHDIYSIGYIRIHTDKILDCIPFGVTCYVTIQIRYAILCYTGAM